MNSNSNIYRNSRLQTVLLICATKNSTTTEIKEGTNYTYKYVFDILRYLLTEGLIERTKKEGRNVYYSTTTKGKKLLSQSGAKRFYVVFNKE